MTFVHVDGLIKITVKNRAEMESHLESAIRSLRMKADEQKACGILVTRHSAYDFTAELHPSVPFGLTRELRKW
jgi:hypothetical protein